MVFVMYIVYLYTYCCVISLSAFIYDLSAVANFNLLDILALNGAPVNANASLGPKLKRSKARKILEMGDTKVIVL